MPKLLAALIIALSLIAQPAYADRGHYRGGPPGHYGGGHHHHERYRGPSPWVGLAIVGALAGMAIMAEQSQPRYVAPAYVEPAYPPQPLYMAPPAYPAPSPGIWYFCRSAQAYYPYVPQCPEGWQAVPATQ